MHRFCSQQASYRFSRRLLIGLCVAALGLGLTCGTGVAAPVRQVSSAPVEDFCASGRSGRILRGDPSNYRRLLPTLRPGDTLLLAPGPYRLLTIARINGAPGRCITITGPATGPRAVIVGAIGSNTVEIVRFELRRRQQSHDRQPRHSRCGWNQGAGHAASCDASHRARQQSYSRRRSQSAE